MNWCENLYPNKIEMSNYNFNLEIPPPDYSSRSQWRSRKSSSLLTFLCGVWSVARAGGGPRLLVLVTPFVPLPPTTRLLVQRVEPDMEVSAFKRNYKMWAVGNGVWDFRIIWWWSNVYSQSWNVIKHIDIRCTEVHIDIDNKHCRYSLHNCSDW